MNKSHVCWQGYVTITICEFVVLQAAILMWCYDRNLRVCSVTNRHTLLASVCYDHDLCEFVVLQTAICCWLVYVMITPCEFVVLQTAICCWQVMYDHALCEFVVLQTTICGWTVYVMITLFEFVVLQTAICRWQVMYDHALWVCSVTHSHMSLASYVWSRFVSS